ncbi:MAB_1171c family putative transporter [Embleya sp. AB8]|uniref:MAB_1171c family putative transporter n=1 Tax=Embleya sp. AB8 TaxID=3156304 RepID=UPI003C74EF7A
MRIDPAGWSDGFELVSTLCLMATVLWCAPSALRNPGQRTLWCAVALAALAMVLGIPAIDRHLVDLGLRPPLVSVSRNLLGVLSAGVLLSFVAQFTGNARVRSALHALVPIIPTTLALLTVIETRGGHDDLSDALDPSHTTAYWVILTGTHLTANIACALLCRRYARRAAEGRGDSGAARRGSRQLRLGMRLFGWAAICAGVYWGTALAYFLLPRVSGAQYARLAIGLHALLRAAALLVPTAATAARRLSDVRTIWRLWPLWHDLVQAVPHVELFQRRPRHRELLTAPAHWRLLLYRKVIEAHDALLDLQGYAHPALLDRARRHVSAAGTPPAGTEPAVLACVIREACRVKRTGSGQAGDHELTVGADRGDLDAEAAFLLKVAGAYDSPDVRSFTALRYAETPSCSNGEPAQPR